MKEEVTVRVREPEPHEAIAMLAATQRPFTTTELELLEALVKRERIREELDSATDFAAMLTASVRDAK